jgi:hypothetical protein
VGIVRSKKFLLAVGLAALLAILIIAIIVRCAIAFRAGDMAITTVMLASAVATDMVCFLVMSATGLVTRLQLMLES